MIKHRKLRKVYIYHILLYVRGYKLKQPCDTVNEIDPVWILEYELWLS